MSKLTKAQLYFLGMASEYSVFEYGHGSPARNAAATRVAKTLLAAGLIGKDGRITKLGREKLCKK